VYIYIFTNVAMFKLLIIDDHQVLLDSLQLLFNSMKNIEVVGVINDSRKVDSFLLQNEVDIIISDLHMPHFSGIDLTYKVRVSHPNIKIILLTMAEDAGHIREALKAGVNAYVLKKTGKTELEIAISKIMEGKKYYSESVIDELASSAGDDLNNASPENIEHLTAREIEVLSLVSQEKSSLEIAEALFISLSTVETHRANLMKKLGVKSSIGMVKFAIKHGLI
jgi:DNA-binding NarL/FixJ family response regulator